jgi:hypothetical protein
MTPESFRKEVITMMKAMAMAEREACIRTALDIGGTTGKLIADRIRKRPPPKTPPMQMR